MTIEIDEEAEALCGIDESTFLGLIIKKLTKVPERTFYQMSFFTGLLEIPKGLTNIGDYAFTACGFSEIKFKDLKTTISVGKSAFSNLTSLTGSIEFPPIDNTNSLQRASSTKKIADFMFYNCTNLHTFNIPEEVEEIGDFAFFGFLHIKKIGRSAFEGCANLRGSLEFDDELTEIKENAFYGCMDFRIHC